MERLKLCESEYRFMTVVWDNGPVPSGRLVELCRERLGWKKSTTYTTVKKLGEKGFLKNEHSIVTPLVPREEVQAFESGYIVDRAFGGSLPAFIAAFTRERGLSEEEAEEIQHLIDQSREVE